MVRWLVEWRDWVHGDTVRWTIHAESAEAAKELTKEKGRFDNFGWTCKVTPLHDEGHVRR